MMGGALQQQAIAANLRDHLVPGLTSHKHIDNNYTFPVRRLGVHLES
jgi:hypothetical protein